MKTIISIVIGIVLMFAGGLLSDYAKTSHMMKPLDDQGIFLDPGKTLAAIGVLIIFMPVMNMFFFNPLHEAIQARTSELESTFGEAESLRAEMGTLRSEYEKRLADTEASAREQIQNTVREAQSLSTSLKAEAQNRANELVKKAEADIEAERQRVMGDLRLHVVDLTLGATEKVLGENVDNERNRKLIAEFVDKIEVPS